MSHTPAVTRHLPALPSVYRDWAWGATVNEVAFGERPIYGLHGWAHSGVCSRRLILEWLEDYEYPPQHYPRETHPFVLSQFLQHCSTEELADPLVARAWPVLFSHFIGSTSRELWGYEYRTVEHAFRTAMSRDGGLNTLAGWPSAGAILRDAMSAKWADDLAAAAQVDPKALLRSAPASAETRSDGEPILMRLFVEGAFEDPFGEGIGHTSDAPTWYTLVAAAQYRHPTHVIDIAVERWGCHVLTCDDYRDEFTDFVHASFPTSAADVVEWERLFRRVDPSVHGLLRRGLTRWRIIPPSLLEYMALDQEGNTHGYGQIPCVTADGEIDPRLLHALPAYNREKLLRYWGESMPRFHAWRLASPRPPEEWWLPFTHPPVGILPDT